LMGFRGWNSILMANQLVTQPMNAEINGNVYNILNRASVPEIGHFSKGQIYQMPLK
jgi:hypothetical protein